MTARTRTGDGRKAKRPRLPAVPTGYEAQDLEWSKLVPYAEPVVDFLIGLDAAGNEKALWRDVLQSYIEERSVERELLGTRVSSSLLLPRYRQWRRLYGMTFRAALAVSSVLLKRFQRRHPKATAGQLLMLLRDHCREVGWAEARRQRRSQSRAALNPRSSNA